MNGLNWKSLAASSLAATLVLGLGLNEKAIAGMFGIVACNSSSACAGGSNAGVGQGVLGTSAQGYGVEGRTTSAGKAGVHGVSAGNMPAILAQSAGGIGVQSASTSGVAITALSSSNAVQSSDFEGAVMATGGGYNGVLGNSVNRSGGVFLNHNTTYYALFAQAMTGGAPLGVAGFSGQSLFNVDGSGNGTFAGSVKASAFTMAMRAPNGTRIGTFVARSTRETIEDTGTARLIAGRGAVSFDPAFASTIDGRTEYQVFLTPDGDTRGLYVAYKSPAGFEVREIQGGRSTLSFDYRIVAHPAGASVQRLPVLGPEPRSAAPGEVAR